MRGFALLAGCTAALAACATPDRAIAPTAAAMAGDWTVDLRLGLADAPYGQPMTLTLAENGDVSGTFYGSTILKGRAGTGQNRACAAWQTADNSGLYHHSGCLRDGEIVGQTWSEGRTFVLPWTARRN